METKVQRKDESSDLSNSICVDETKTEQKFTRDEDLVKLVEVESIIWQRNHPQFKNHPMKEQAWGRIALQLGVSTTDAERRFKSIREKYRRRKILLERDSTNNVEHSKLKRWDLYSKLGFLDDFMIPRNGSESLGTIQVKSESVSSENISSTNNEISIHPLPMHHLLHTSTPTSHHHLNIRPMVQISQHQTVPQSFYSRSSQSTPSPSTTTANVSADRIHLSPEVKMEVADDEDEDSGENEHQREPKSCETGNFNYVGDYIAAELNKLPLRDAFVLKNILIREVLNFSDRLMMGAGGSTDKQ